MTVDTNLPVEQQPWTSDSGDSGVVLFDSMNAAQAARNHAIYLGYNDTLIETTLTGKMFLTACGAKLEHRKGFVLTRRPLF